MAPLALLLFLGALSTPRSGALTPVAVVNGVPVRQWEAERELASRIPATALHSRVSPEKQRELRQQSLDALVLKELKRQWASERKHVPDSKAAEEAWKKVRDRFPSQKAYDEALKEAGLTDSEFRKAFGRDEAAAEVDRTVRADVPPPTGEEVQGFFRSHSAEYVKPEARHLVVALVYVDPGGGEAARKAGQDEAEALAARTRAGSSLLAEAERLKTLLPPKYRDRSGDLGFVHRGSLLPEIEAEVFEAEVPSIRGPVQTIYGYQVIQVLAARAAEPLALDAVRDVVAARIRRERESEAVSRFEAELMKNARVERLGWVPGR